MRASIPYVINWIARHTPVTLAKAFMRIIMDAQAKFECARRKISPRPIGLFPSQLDLWIHSKDNYQIRMNYCDARLGKTLDVDAYNIGVFCNMLLLRGNYVEEIEVHIANILDR